MWQIGSTIIYFKYIFAEYGACIYIDNQLIIEKNMLDHCDRLVLNTIISKALFDISQMPIIYHGNQIDFRKGLIYISPPGMQSTNYERSFFMQQDKYLDLRNKLLCNLKNVDSKNLFEISLGGSVGIAVYPAGWNKSQVIDYLVSTLVIKDNTKIYYFGDRCDPTGNDYPIYNHTLVTGVVVINYIDTVSKINSMFFDN